MLAKTELGRLRIVIALNVRLLEQVISAKSVSMHSALLAKTATLLSEVNVFALLLVVTS